MGHGEQCTSWLAAGEALWHNRCHHYLIRIRNACRAWGQELHQHGCIGPTAAEVKATGAWTGGATAVQHYCVHRPARVRRMLEKEQGGQGQ